ncbi:hypothetical protein KCP73_13700 [Salmonella enterica subsp. enterica]|nr:hypothetical protein KCP73_13700 [Salmonella enterica subsp. enterica]
MTLRRRLGIKINGQAQVLEGQKVNLLLKRGQQEICLSNQVVRVTAMRSATTDAAHHQTTY